jgi:hypothetical protein
MYREKKALNRITEIKVNRALITKADKGNSIIIIYMTDHNSKVQTFLTNNSFHTETTDPSTRFQTEIRKNINSCSLDYS